MYGCPKKVIKREVGKYESSRQAGDVPHAPKAIGRLPKGARILILEEAEFLNKPVSPKARPGTTELQPFGLAQAFDKNGKLTEEKFWVTLLPGYMTEEGSSMRTCRSGCRKRLNRASLMP
ncbi:hypothetical protein GGER_19690 [Serratia rubidaea]